MPQDMICQVENIAKQLTEIYYKYEDWHKTRMSHEEALNYHKEGLNNGTITVCLENGEVLGYYERFYVDNSCFLRNIWIKPDERQGRVMRQLKKVFFGSMPDNITQVIGEKQKLGGKLMIEKIRR